MRRIVLICTLLGFIFCACSKSNDDPILSLTPEIEFVKTFGGSKNESAQSILKTLDGGYIITGFTQSMDGDITTKTDESFDFLVLKYDSSDNLQWFKNYGGTNDERAFKIIQTNDGGYAIIGFSDSEDIDVSLNNGSDDIWLLKITSSGNISWEKSFGFSGIDQSFSIIQTSDGGYFISGIIDVSASAGEGNDRSQNRRHAGGDYWGIKLDSSGAKIWRRYFGGSFTDSAFDVIETQDHGFLLVGSSDSTDVDITSNKGSYDYWVVKIDATGNLIWEKSYGGSQIDQARSIISTADGNYLIVGESRSNDGDIMNANGAADVWLIKISPKGSLIWEKSYGGSSFDVARHITPTSDNGYLISGSSRSLDGDLNTNNGQNDVWVLKINDTGNMQWQKSIGGTGIDFAYCATELNNDSYIVVGESSSSDIDINENKGFTDLLLTKIKLK